MSSAPEQYLALVCTGDALCAALWQQLQKKITIIAHSRSVPLRSMQAHDFNEAVDRALDELGEAGLSIKHVLFGVPNNWVDADGLTAEKKSLLKALTQDLLLDPLGYVVNSDAVAAAEEERGHHAFSGLLITPTKKEIFLERYNEGVLTPLEPVGQSGEEMQDVKELLARLQPPLGPKERVMIIHTGAESNAESLEKLLAVQLHRPLESLTVDQLLNYVVTEGGAKTLSALPKEDEMPAMAVAPISDDNLDSDFKPPAFLSAAVLGEAVAPELIDEDQPIIHHSAVEQAEGHDEVEPLVAATHPKKKRAFAFVLPKWKAIRLPKLPVQFSGKKTLPLAIGGAVLVVLLLIGFGYFSLSRSYSVQANVWLKTNELSQTKEFIVPNGGVPTASMSALQTESITESVTIDKEVPTTGTKIIGDNAKGTITIYNHTFQTKSFPKGTKLTTGKFTFTLDDNVTVASASSSSDPLSLGTAAKVDAKVTAALIGPDSNLDKGQQFNIANFDKSSYIGQNNDPLSGGSSREIQAVAQKDIDSASRDLLQAATGQLEDKITAESTPDAPVLFAHQVSVTKTETSADVGTEQKFVKVTLTVEGKGLKISPDELKRVAQETFAGEVQGGQVIQTEKTLIHVDDVSMDKTSIHLKTTITTQAIPNLTASSLQTKIVGLYVPRAVTVLQEQDGVARAQVSTTPAWASLLFKNVPTDLNRVHFNLRIQEQP